MDTCLTCGGVIFEFGRLYGYSGKVCYCAESPRVRRRASEETHSSVLAGGLGEIEALRAQLAQVTKERDEANDLLARHCIENADKGELIDSINARLARAVEALEDAKHTFEHGCDGATEPEWIRGSIEVIDNALDSPDLAPYLERERARDAVIEAARGIGMNWKLGAPYGFDAVSEALTRLDDAEKTLK